MESGKRYSEAEGLAILKKAAELQAQGPLSGKDGRSFTLEELEKIAQDSGLPPHLVQSAAGTVGRPKQAGGWLGAPAVLEAAREIVGELDRRDLAELVAEIEHGLEESGRVRVQGSALRWKSRLGQRNVQLRSSGGVLKIKATESLGAQIGGLFGGLVGGVAGGALGLALGVGLGVLGSAGAALVLWAGPVALAYFIARSILSGQGQRKSQRLEELVDDVARRANELVAQRAARRSADAELDGESEDDDEYEYEYEYETEEEDDDDEELEPEMFRRRGRHRRDDDDDDRRRRSRSRRRTRS
ncbi:MAG: hypothetical protein AAF533_14040 [Acidobacteriota bacterium]